MIKIKFILLILVMISFTNCSTQKSDASTSTVTATLAATNTTLPTLTLKPTKVVTPIPTATDLPTLTPAPTLTPLPTLSANQAKVKVKELLETNGGCELPCWWGITPNKTTWADLSHFLSPIFQLNQQPPKVRTEYGKEHTYTDYQFYFDIPGESQAASIILEGRDNIVFWATIFPPAAEYRYQLHQVLTLLGSPKQIFISAQASSPISELPPTMLVLDYSDKGVWASYGYIPTLVGENLEVCPKSSLGTESTYDNIGGMLELFSPNTEYPNALSIKEYADMVGGFSAKKLEDVTNMNVETFYNTFIDPQTEICIETPANLWP